MADPEKLVSFGGRDRDLDREMRHGRFWRTRQRKKFRKLGAARANGGGHLGIVTLDDGEFVSRDPFSRALSAALTSKAECQKSCNDDAQHNEAPDVQQP